MVRPPRQVPLAKTAEKLSNRDGAVVAKDLLRLLKEYPQVKELFARFGVSIDRIDDIPVRFKEMDVSAKAKKGTIYLNKWLLEDADLVEELHYIVHEITHILQQWTGEVEDFGDLDHIEYLDNPLEVEAFKEQIRFIGDYKSNEEAREYLDGLLDFHEFKGEERAEKARELGGDDLESKPAPETAKKPQDECSDGVDGAGPNPESAPHNRFKAVALSKPLIGTENGL